MIELLLKDAVIEMSGPVWAWLSISVTIVVTTLYLWKNPIKKTVTINFASQNKLSEQQIADLINSINDFDGGLKINRNRIAP